MELPTTDRHPSHPEDAHMGPSHAPDESKATMTIVLPVDAKDAKTTSPRSRVSRSLKNNAAEMLMGAEEVKKPLHLLDLPVDILKDIVKEVTHTNDLTSLALCHSALHRLAIPHIYSRFDIVWPDTTNPSEPRTGVDALTYGLATLVMAEDVFGESSWQIKRQKQTLTPVDPPIAKPIATTTAALNARVRRRRGNYYAQFTRKFSLGNGPPEWVQEYLITKEGGKMLGTLVALAVARMRSLETFVWDMPTGILRDVWMALSSLGDHDDGQPCRLERVSVRCHDNNADLHLDQDRPPLPPAPPQPSPPPHALRNLPPPMYSMDHVEHPSFSILPPLKSLSVLDIDELQYLDEMSVLIGRSQSSLRELRVGITRHLDRDWSAVWEDEHAQQVDKNHTIAGSVTIGEKRLGGILGVLTGWVSDMHRTYALPHRPKRLRRRSNVAVTDLQESTPDTVLDPIIVPSNAAETQVPLLVPDLPVSEDLAIHFSESTAGVTVHAELAESTTGVLVNSDLTEESHTAPAEAEHNDISALSVDDIMTIPKSSPDLEPPPILDAQFGDGLVSPITSEQAPEDISPETVDLSPENEVANPAISSDEEEPRLAGQLCLETLELERVPLSIPVLQNVFDWGKLTSLTLLECPNHEHLWKALRRSYSPSALTAKQYSLCDPSRITSGSSRVQASTPFEYKLNLKKIHTDMVSSSLISFIKEALAPNSLQMVFLQKARGHAATVSIDAIFRGVLKKHRNSLSKVLIDSGEKDLDGHLMSNTTYKHWMLNREVLRFISSGKMPALRELGAALDYRDWHYFLQNLPSVPHLRSLYVPYLANYIQGNFAEPRELALQIVDIIALRPEVELCYLGIAKKCFEIIESRKDNDGPDDSQLGSTPTDDDMGSDEDAEDDDDDADEDSDEDAQSHATDSDGSHSDHVDSDSEDGTGTVGKRLPKLRLREILYYDDKVTIFKARHGKL